MATEVRGETHRNKIGENERARGWVRSPAQHLFPLGVRSLRLSELSRMGKKDMTRVSGSALGRS